MKEAINAVLNYLEEAFWDFTGALYDIDHYRMMSNPPDRKIYLDAVNKLNAGSKSETFTLEDGEVVTIYRN